jgi:iron-sulfur cluster repair protein YtfE (RIC family)
MSTIPDYMTQKHRHCDDIFTTAESAAAQKNWPEANRQWQLFVNELELHLQAEENILFPQFEQATGMSAGPTQVMRGEHQQMRALIDDINKALKAENKDQFLGLSETLMILMQQHNMKEEMMLYPMCQQQIPQVGEVQEKIAGFCD